MTDPVWVFFYGSYMNRHVLAESHLAPRVMEAARLWGFDIRIGPLANLVRSDGHCVYGILAAATHDELERLYRHAEKVLLGRYYPEAVLVETVHGLMRPALCYIAPPFDPEPPKSDYVDRIIAPAIEFGFPEWYVKRLESFKTQS